MDKEAKINLSDIQKAKQVVLEKALGICALDELKLFETLEEIYWRGFKAGLEKKGETIDKKWYNSVAARLATEKR